MEKLAFKNCHDRILENSYDVQVLGTDRHPGIRKMLREEYDTIDHQFDLWHYSKSLKKKLPEACRKPNCHELQEWIAPIVNHFYWCSRTCRGDVNLFWKLWTSLLFHVRNIHQWEEDGQNSACLHGELSIFEKNARWLVKPSPPYKALEDIIASKQLKNDIPFLVLYCCTGAIEVFHSNVLKYRSKRLHYRMNSMEARTTVAILEHDNNVGRQQAIVKRKTTTSEDVGQPRTRLEHPRSRKRWIVRTIYDPVTSSHVYDIMDTILRIAGRLLDSTWINKEVNIPRNIAPTERPVKEEAVARYRS
ncbi:uncharacterized protein LOC143984197 [Lithobates pipiens]